MVRRVGQEYEVYSTDQEECDILNKAAVFTDTFGRNAVTPSLIDDSTGNIDQLHLLLPPEPSNYKRKGTTGQERWQRSIVAERWRQRGCQNSEEVR